MRFGESREFTDGDVRFVGVDATRDRAVLTPGMMALAQNGRCRTGAYAQRKGTTRPSDFNLEFDNRLIGSGVFRDPNGDEALLVAPASDTYTWALRFGKDPVQILYKSSVVGDNGIDGVNFVQSFENLQLLRFPIVGAAKNLVWNGDYDQTNDANKWNEVVLSTNGATLVPPMWNGEPFQDRVIYYDQNFSAVIGRDIWLLSDDNDYTSYDDVFQVGRVNSGESDFITRIFAYYHGSFVVFKTQSIHMVTMLPDVYPLRFQQRILSVRLGSYGPRLPLETGGDIIFLSNPGGFFRLSEVIQDSITTLPVAISEPIQPIINQLQWGATGIFGCSASIDNYALFGVAIGSAATRPNAILVYNTQSRQWESVPDTWADPNFGFNALHVTVYDLVRRVFAIDYDNSVIYLLYEGTADDMAGGLFPVPFKMETRGYVGDDPISFKCFRRVVVGISTSNPSVKVTAIADGYNEEKVLLPNPITKSRTKFYLHGRGEFNPDTDDPNEPMREDYSDIGSETSAIEDFENLAEGYISLLPPTGVDPGGPAKQQTAERMLYRGTGRWLSLRVENNQGICDVLAASVEGTQSMTNIKTAA